MDKGMAISYSNIINQLSKIPDGIVSTYINAEWYGVKLENGSHVDLINVTNISGKVSAFNGFNNAIARRIQYGNQCYRNYLYGTGMYIKGYGFKLHFYVVDDFGELQRVPWLKTMKITYILHGNLFGGLNGS